MSNNDVLHKAIETYGKDAQLDMCVEEMSELTKEICKTKRGNANRKEIIEELVDVSIMINQLQIMYNVTEQEFYEMYDKKVCRLEERLNNGKINILE